MDSMFFGATKFNQNIGYWDTSQVTNMSAMFFDAKNFNQDLGYWTTSQVEDMSYMFANASAFDQDLGEWNVESLNYNFSAQSMFLGIKLSIENYDSLLMGWSEQNLESGVNFSGGNSTYCDGESARTKMIEDFSWTITDGGKNCSTSSNINLFLPLILSD
jgi:surface protein